MRCIYGIAVQCDALLTGALHAHRDRLGDVHFVVSYHNTPEYVGSGHGVSRRGGLKGGREGKRDEKV